MTFYIFLTACCAAATTGTIFKPGAWYESLQKPKFTPPNWLFPVAWTTVYLLLAWAGYRLTALPGSQTVRALWAAQIALPLWKPVFFGRESYRCSHGDTRRALDCCRRDGGTGIAARRHHRTHPVPVPWLCVAAALNFSILRNNR
ncbi:MAG TPA: TspO/MBR family protein [Pseudomonas sp.]|nr:TspO/MBR family protein [Pseudomonas sp.]